jgi:hypothetical protein
MKKTLMLFILCAVALFSCAHGGPEKRGIGTMLYAYPLEDVISASKTVLTEREFEIVEINMTDNYIKAIKGARIPGKPITVILNFRTEGDNTTWIEMEKDVPPQFIPGSTAGYRMDITDLFRYIESELDRNY